MAFAFTEDQRELRDAARRYLRDTLPLERAASIAESALGWDPASWNDLAELGWLGVTVTEDLGGAGLGFVEQAIVLEELGRALYSGPYLATVLALPALDPDDQARVVCGKERWSIEIDGVVPELDRVDRVVTAEGAAAAAGETVPGLDPTRPVGRRRSSAAGPLPGAVDRAAVLTALGAEALGVAQRVLDMGVEYVTERRQFGKPIGLYQAVAHPLADTFCDLELARSLVYAAACGVTGGRPDALRSASIAKAFGTEAAVRAAERVIQVHGGIGFTWEHPLHRFYRRALWLRAFGGYPASMRDVVRAELAGR